MNFFRMVVCGSVLCSGVRAQSLVDGIVGEGNCTNEYESNFVQQPTFDITVMCVCVAGTSQYLVRLKNTGVSEYRWDDILVDFDDNVTGRVVRFGVKGVSEFRDDIIRSRPPAGVKDPCVGFRALHIIGSEEVKRNASPAHTPVPPAPGGPTAPTPAAPPLAAIPPAPPVTQPLPTTTQTMADVIVDGVTPAAQTAAIALGEESRELARRATQNRESFNARLASARALAEPARSYALRLLDYETECRSHVAVNQSYFYGISIAGGIVTIPLLLIVGSVTDPDPLALTGSVSACFLCGILPFYFGWITDPDAADVSYCVEDMARQAPKPATAIAAAPSPAAPAGNGPTHVPFRLGISLEDVSPTLAKSVGLPEGVGARILNVQADSLAHRLGVLPDDILLVVSVVDFSVVPSRSSIVSIRSAADVRAVIAGVQRGETVTLQVFRPSTREGKSFQTEWNGTN